MLILSIFLSKYLAYCKLFVIFAAEFKISWVLLKLINNYKFCIMKIRTTSGELVKVSQKEIIWNALDALCYPDDGVEDVYLSLLPRRKGIYVSRVELTKVVETFHHRYLSL